MQTAFNEYEYGDYIAVYPNGGMGDVTWNNSLIYCQETYGTSLASIHSASDNSDARAAANGVGITDGLLIVWIGLSDLLNESVFIWTDGTNVDYTNWDVSNPSNSGGDEHCAHLMVDDGEWNDLECEPPYGATWQPGGFICNAPTTAPSNAPSSAPS